MKKGRVWSKLPSPSSRFVVWWVDCGAFLFSHGQNYGGSMPPNKPSPVCCKPDHVLSAKKSWKKDWLCFYRGIQIIKCSCRAIVALVRPRSKTKGAVESSQDKGFSVVALCLILPLFMVLIAIFILLSFWLKNFWSAQKICEESVLKAQSSMSELVPEILKLNPEILKLRKLKTALRLKLAAAIAHGNAPVAATLKIQLKAVETRLLILFAEQNFILQKAQHIRWQTLSHFRNKTLSLNTTRTLSPFFYPLALGLTPDQALERPPIYQVTASFTEQQRLELQWKQNLFHHGPLALMNILSLNTTWMKRACSASLESKNRKWYARLLKAKEFSSY